MPAPAEAICQEIAWKNPELRRFCVAFIKAALAQEAPHFTTDLVGDDVRSLYCPEPGPGMAGSAVTVLKAASLIKPVGVTIAGKFYHDRTLSTRPGTKGRHIGVYMLTSVPLAKEFLARNGVADVVGRVPSPGAPQNQEEMPL